MDPVAWRLRSQKLAGTTCRAASEMVSWLGAIQAQDYRGACWAIALRSKGLTQAAIGRAFDEGALLRTHVMRPTWHFVAPEDIRWMQMLTGWRVHARNAPYYRNGGLDEPALRHGVKVLERSLRDRNYLTRDALGNALASAGRPLHGQALAYVMMYAELEGVACSGPRQGKQFTYALLDERTAPAAKFTRDEALAALVQRYFTSHGPATFRDFAWWSGMTVRDAKDGVGMNGDALAHETIDGLTYWFSPDRPARPPTSPAVFLLPNYDEFGIAYRDRKLLRSVPRPTRLTGEFAHLLVIDRQLAGRWRQEVKPRRVVVYVQPFRTLTRAENGGVEAQVKAYGAFMELATTMTFV